MKKILIADDSLFMRNILKDILIKVLGDSEKCGFASGQNAADSYKILEASSGPEALKQFENEKPDLMLLDIIMPEGEEEGINVLRRVMKRDPNQRVIMITAVGQDEIKEECKKLGARDYIMKPFNEEQIAETVRKHLLDC